VHHETPPPDEPPKPPPLCHFLLIEDNPLNVKVCSTLLSKMGHSVTVAENGQLAVEAVAAGLSEQGTHAFDIALMDCEMPVMDGFEATRQIRMMERERNVLAELPIVALSVRCPTGLTFYPHAFSLHTLAPPHAQPAADPPKRRACPRRRVRIPAANTPQPHSQWQQ
jgi:CheY-like chemotaxis protein